MYKRQLNACAADDGLRTFARETMTDDLARLENIPGSMYNFHPGSHVKQGTQVGIALIADHLNAILTPKLSTTVLLETCLLYTSRGTLFVILRGPHRVLDLLGGGAQED